MGRWWPLVALALAQFLMVLDQSVMNVSISQLVADFDTSVSTIQAVITLYSLVMAMFMLAGGKVGDIIGRRRAFAVGLVVYGAGSALTAIAPSVVVLTLGWSVLEGLGAALVLPALVSLIAGNYEGPDRAVAYAVIGGMAGAGIAVGPIVGGWATTQLSWRVVFVGEVVLVLVILALVTRVTDVKRPGPSPRIDVVGVVLSAAGLGLVVLGVLRASSWGWLEPRQSPVEPFGFSLTPFVVLAGAVLLWGFVRWEARRESAGRDPLVHLALLEIPSLRAGLVQLLSQNLVLMGVFFGLPLYLQLVLGLDALQTGFRMLPVSVAMFVTSALGSRLATSRGPRAVVRAGLVTTLVAVVALLATVRPTLGEVGFALAMAGLGVGMGLIVSQLGNVVQSSVDASGRGEAGGLQFTGQQLGSSLGIALMGAVVLGGLSSSFLANVEADQGLTGDDIATARTAIEEADLDFLPVEAVETAARDIGFDQAATDAIVDDYQAAQLRSLRAGLLVAALLAFGALPFTRHLPRGLAKDDADQQEARPPPAGPEAESVSQP